MQNITSDNTEHPSHGKQDLELDNRREGPILTTRQNILVALGLVPAIFVAILANSAFFIPGKGEQHYADVPFSSTFFTHAERLNSMGLAPGYPCGLVPQEPCDEKERPYFRPGEASKRGELARLLVKAVEARVVTGQDQSADLPPGTQTFADVPPTHPFYRWVEEAARGGFMRGYPCGGLGEPCDPRRRPYFRPDGVVSRAELALSIYQTDLQIQDNPKTVLKVSFEDVPEDHPFWLYIEQVYGRGIMTGYACSERNASTPCVPPGNRAYFRPDAPTTNGQVARAIATALLER
jgi:hypothetical protein